MGNFTIEQSHLSLEYVFVPVSASSAGTSYNPTADAVAFAFMPTATQIPVNSDWVSGSWTSVPTNVLYPYSVKCLVGPGGSTAPGIGLYVMYVRITDSPEVPVDIAGYLQIT